MLFDSRMGRLQTAMNFPVWSRMHPRLWLTLSAAPLAVTQALTAVVVVVVFFTLYAVHRV